jgi:hypothetical protein
MIFFGISIFIILTFIIYQNETHLRFVPPSEGGCGNFCSKSFFDFLSSGKVSNSILITNWNITLSTLILFMITYYTLFSIGEYTYHRIYKKKEN